MIKKILLVLVLFSVVKVHALSYSDYSEFGDYSEHYSQKDDLTDVKIERRYKYYKLGKVFGPYVYKDKINENFPLLLENDYIYSDYSDLSVDKPEDKEGRIIDTIEGYKYQKLKPINYLKIYNHEDQLNLENFNMKYKDESIDYKLEGCSGACTLDNQKAIKFLFNDNIDVNELVFSFNFKKTTDAPVVFTISTGDGNRDYTVGTYAYYNNENFLLWEGKYSSYYNDNSLLEYFYSTEKLSTTFIVRLIGQETLYKYRDIMYRSYGLKKEYYPDYLTNEYGEYQYRDENEYKDYYSKRLRTPISEKTSLVKMSNLELLQPKTEKTELKVSSITKPTSVSRVIYKPVINSEPQEKNCNNLYFLIFIFSMLGIIILLLSKHYKKKK